MTVTAEKVLLRTLFLHKIRHLSQVRREQARQDCLQMLKSTLPAQGIILSFFPLPSEINIEPVNTLLKKEGRLALAKLEKDNLIPYLIKEDTTFCRSAQSFMEPVNGCLLAIEKIQACIIPGIAFDKHNHRLGRGHGHYDRFLAKLSTLHHRPRLIGVGFIEQGYDGILPVEDHDIALETITLF